MYLLWAIVNNSVVRWRIKAHFDVFKGLKWAKPYEKEQVDIEVVLDPGERKLVYAKEFDSL